MPQAPNDSTTKTDALREALASMSRVCERGELALGCDFARGPGRSSTTLFQIEDGTIVSMMPFSHPAFVPGAPKPDIPEATLDAMAGLARVVDSRKPQPRRSSWLCHLAAAS